MAAPLLWPSDRTEPEEVCAWISSVLDGNPRVAGPHIVLASDLRSAAGVFLVDPEAEQPPVVPGQDRRASARLTRRDNRVFFKAGYLPELAHSPAIHELLTGHVPENVPYFLASTQRDGQTWMLFQYLEGDTVLSRNEFELWLQTVRTLARIQVRVAALPQEEMLHIPAVFLDSVLALFDDDMRLITNTYVPLWRKKWVDYCTILPQLGQLNVDEVLLYLDRIRPILAGWCQELMDGAWPNSITHFDLHTKNAVRPYDRPGITIVDWDGSTISCPFFSLESLMTEATAWDTAGGIRYSADEVMSPHMQRVCEVYLEEVPWHAPHERLRAFDLALCLSPIPLLDRKQRMIPPSEVEVGAFEAARIMFAAIARWGQMERTGRVLPEVLDLR
jgi:hypothetical protein